MMDGPSPPDRRVLLGVGLVCFANVLLEVVLTRLFSALMYYHFTFFAIALALLGMGASGVYVYVRAERLAARPARHHLAVNAQRFGVATVLALIYVLANPITIITGTNEIPRLTNQTAFQLLLLSGFTGLPFFFAGVVVSLAVSHYRRHIERVYFYDLAGAGLAALVAGLLIGLLGGPALVLGVAVCASAAGVLFLTERPRRAAALPIALAGLLIAGLFTSWFAMPSVKGVRTGRVMFEGWNTFSRVTLERLPDRALDIKIDASAATRVTHAREAAGARWRQEVSALGYAVKAGGAQQALIIGPGGGRDVAHALASGARRVIGVEVNPLIATTIMRERFVVESGGLYSDPRVSIVVDEGRSFIRRSRERYDVIQASLVDTWAATSAGAFALTENTLYTLEAFDDYYEHLTDEGVVTMSRWHSGSDPETVRLVMLAAGALERRGVSPGETRKYLFLATKDSLGTLLAKRTPFSPEELVRLEEAARAGGFTIELSPIAADPGRLGDLVAAGAWSAQARAFPQNILPPTDDKPFFFYFVKPGQFWTVGRDLARGAQLTNPAVWILIALGAMLVALTVLFIFVPLLATKVDDLRGGGKGGARRRGFALGYFAAIGLAFMVVEMAVMQRLSLFLGHPSYALVVVLFSILVSSAVGARFSGRFRDERRGLAVVVAGLLVAALAVVAALWLAPVLRALVGVPLYARMVLSGAVVAVFGFVMGVMLPMGVRLVSDRDSSIVAWAWGINGGMSVIGTVCATTIAIHLGFTATLLVGAALYLLAGLGGMTLHRLVGRASVSAQPTQAAADPVVKDVAG